MATISVSLFCVASIEVYTCPTLSCIEAGVTSTSVLWSPRKVSWQEMLPSARSQR